MLEFGILGPLEVRFAGRPVRLPGSASRQVLAALVLRAGEWQSIDRLIDGLWGEQPPRLARKALQMHVSRVRGALAAAAPESAQVLVSGPGGYRLAVDEEQVDAARFGRLVEQGRGALAEGDPRRARELLERALGLWRGAPLAELGLDGTFVAELGRLEELRLVALEQRIAALLELGLVDEAIGDAQRLVAEHPWRERLHAQLMLALYRGGRQAEALEAYRRARAILVEQLGLEPGSELRDLERQILQHELSLEPWPRAGPVAANLPGAPTPFLGRVRELGAIAALLREGGVRLLTLTGAGGSGKTRLALRLAEESAGDYRDGACFVGFADVADPGLIASTICEALELAEQPSLTPADRLRAWLSERELLLVLDNLEQLVKGAIELGELVATCPGLTLLVTSREPLHLAAEQQYEVPVLAHGDAVELFTTRAQAVKPHAEIDSETAGRICQRLDCLPLAIELAAARTKALAPAEILTRLETRLPLLTGGPRDAPRRQQTLKATIDWSFHLLNSAEQRLFARLAVFAGGCTVAAAEAVCHADPDTLQGLVDRSLVRHAGDRYALLQTIREYALEHLEETGEAETLRRAHAAWFVAVLEAEGIAPPGWPRKMSLHRLVPERDNFRAALEWTSASGAFEARARLVSSLAAVWVMQGQLQEGQRWIRRVHQHEHEYSGPLAAQVASAALRLSRHRPDKTEAAALAKRALELWRDVGDPTAIGRAMVDVGYTAALSGDLNGGRIILKEAVRYARENALSEALAGGLSNLADLAIMGGNLKEGRELCEESLALTVPGWAVPDMVLINLAHIEMLEGNPAKAVRICRQALDSALLRDDSLWIAWAAIELAWALAKERQFQWAGRLLGAALEFLHTSGAEKDWMSEVCEEATCEILCEQLGEQPLQALLTEGRHIPLQQAARDAIGLPTNGRPRTDPRPLSTSPRPEPNQG